MKKLTVLIGNKEAMKIRVRLNELNLTQNKLAEEIGVEERYIRKILKINKDKPMQVGKDKIDKMSLVLGIGTDYLFEKDSSQAIEDKSYLMDVFKKWSAKITKHTTSKEQGKIIIEDETQNRTVRFGNTAIMKSIADHYSPVKDFFEKNTSFSMIPKEKYWKYFSTTPDKIKNNYVLFKLIPTTEQSHFKIAYTLKSKINLLFIPNQIKILYGEIITYENHREIIQHYNTPSIYKIKNCPNEINVITWIDQMEHDFVISSDDDFELIFSEENVKTRDEVKQLFSNINIVVFQKHPYFHRQKLGEIADDVSFFWGNNAFLDFNSEIKNNI